MIKTNNQYVIVFVQSEGKDMIFNGKSENVNHVLSNSDAKLIDIVEVKYFNNLAEYNQALQMAKIDFTGDSVLEDVIFYDCDLFVRNNDINTEEKTVKIYDYNETIYTLLTEWFNASNEARHKLNKDDKGYYIVTGINIFSPNKLYMTEQDAKENHYKQYLQIKLNELQQDRNNWILKETITEEEFRARCSFLDRLNGAKMYLTTA